MLRRAALLIFFLLAGALFYTAYSILKPYRAYEGEVFVDIPRGAGTLEISARLQSAGVLRSEWPFWLIRLSRSRGMLKAGEYRFDRPLSPLQVYRKIASGEVFYYSLTIPEGYDMFQIAEAVARTGIMNQQQFLEAARHGERVAAFAPGAKTLEGFLFPDTYRLTRQTTAEELVGQMVRRFRDVFREVQGEHPPQTQQVLETVILASLVEKETPVAAERPMVASVFRNRLRIGMPLQCDPTVIYALELAGRYTGEIRKEDLAFPSPYNTYLHPGLPPGPIASPGRASIEAAVNPAKTDYLYFVADNKGGHVFSANLEKHSQAVASYRRANGRRPGPPQSAKKDARRR
jgi:UPF0755 protein